MSFTDHKIRFAKKLRKNMTDAEIVLWNAIRGRKCSGLKFRRQVPIGWYIVDFLCMEKSLVIE
jgi:very-short-patch-repair endonuclease